MDDHDEEPNECCRRVHEENRKLRAWVEYLHAIAEYRGRRLELIEPRDYPFSGRSRVSRIST
jgi:hypothetical protein